MNELRIIYLDIDGVLLPGEYLWTIDNNRTLSPKAVELMIGLGQRIDYKIVLSSTWRKMPDGPRNILQCWPEIPLYDKDKPYSCVWKRVDSFSCTPILDTLRGEEIALHRETLRKHLGVDFKYAIIDDDDDMLEEQLPYFVQTQFKTGVQQEHIDKLYDILTRG